MIKATAELNFQLSQRNINQLLRSVQTQMKGVDLRINTTGAQRDIDALGKSIDRATGFAGQFGLAVGESARKFSAYAFAATTISNLAGLFSSATSEVLKFDKDLVKLTQVTGKFGAQLDGITQHLLDLSVRTGISIGKLGELTTTLAQADLKGRDLANAIEVIAKSDLAPSFENMTDSVEGLIAIMQQFKRPSSELAKQYGYINNLSKQSAVESADLIEAVKRSGSVFESAGASLEEFAAMMAVVRSTTRESAETIATGLKTIVERIQRPEIIDQLRQLGVELETVEGKFIGPRIAFERLSDALRKRGSLEKGSFELINVAKEIGGGRQLSKLIPLLNSGTQSARMMERAMQGAATSIDDDAAIAMKSLSKQIDVLKAKFTKFFVEFSLSDEFKEIAKAALTFADAMVEVLRATKPFIPIATSLATFFGGRAIYRGFSGITTPRFKTAKVDGAWDGGQVRGGSGAPGIDDVPKMLANGEYVIRTKSAMGVGYGKLDYINRTGKLPKGMYSGGRVGGGLSEAASGTMAGIGSLLAFQLAINSFAGNTEDANKNVASFNKIVAGSIPLFIVLTTGFRSLSSVLATLNATITTLKVKSEINKQLEKSGMTSYYTEESDNRRKAGLSTDRAKFSSVTEAVRNEPITKRVMDQTNDPALAKLARRVFYDEAQKSGDYRKARDVAFQKVSEAYENKIKDRESAAGARVEKASQVNTRAKTAFKDAGLNVSKKDLATSRSELDAIRTKLAANPEVDVDALRASHAADRKALDDAETRRSLAKINSAEVKAGKHKASPFFEGQVRNEERLSKAELAKAKKLEQQSSRALIAGQATNRGIAADRDVLKQVRREYAILKKLNDSNEELSKAKTDQAAILGAETVELREATRLSAENKEAVKKHKDALNKSVASLGKTLSGQGFNALSVAGLTSDKNAKANRASLLANSESSIQALKQQSDDAFDRVTSGPRNLKRDEARFAAANAARVALYAGPRGRGFRAKAIAAGRELSEATTAVNNSRRVVAQKQQDLDLIRVNKMTMSVLQKRISSLKSVISSEEKLTKEQNKTTGILTREIAARVNAIKAGIIDRGSNLLRRLRTDPQETWRSRGARVLGRVGGFIESRPEIIMGGFAAAIALVTSRLQHFADVAREAADQAIASGDGNDAYNKSLRASKLQAEATDFQTNTGTAVAVGSAAAYLGAGAVVTKIGAVVGTAIAPGIGTAIGATIAAGLAFTVSKIVGLGGIIEEFATGAKREAEALRKAELARRQGNINRVGNTVDEGLKKFAEATGPNSDRIGARTGLTTTIRDTLKSVANVGTPDTREDLVRLYASAADEIRIMGDEALENGKGFEEVARMSPELVKAFEDLTYQINDINFTEQTTDLKDFYNKEAELRSKENLARSLALISLKEELSERKKMRDSIRTFNVQNAALNRASENITIMSQSLTGDLNTRAIKDFGISLTDSDTVLSTAFEETLNALVKLNPELDDQANKYRELLQASESFNKKLPEILNLKTPNAQATEGRKAIKESFGKISETLGNDFALRLDRLLKEQEGSGLSEQERANQIQGLSDTIRESAIGELGKIFEDFRTKEVSDRFTALSQKIAAEIDARTKSVDLFILANDELSNFKDQFNKVNFAEIRSRRLSKVDTVLKGVGESTTGNDAADYQRLSNLRKSLAAQLVEINNKSKNNLLTENEIALQANLVGRINDVSKALSILTDTSAELSKVQEIVAEQSDRQTKLRSKASELAFGGADVRNQFARVLTAQKFVSAGGNLQSLPAEIRGELYSFLQEFGDAKVFNGESGTEIINKQTANFLRSLGFSNEEAMSLITDMVPIEERQLRELKKIVLNTATQNVTSVVPNAGASSVFKPKGVDTIPAMVRPGEYIVSAKNARRNRGALDAINSGDTIYASTSGRIEADGTLTPPKKSTPLHESIKQMHQDNLQKTYDRGAKIRSDADKVQKRKIRSFDPYESATNAMYDLMYQGRRLLEYTKESRDQSQVDSLSLMKTPSSSLDATDKFKDKYLPHQGGKYTREYAGAVNQYHGQTAYVNSPDRLTADEKLDIAQKHARYLAEGGAARDPTGMSKRFNKDSVLVYGMEGGNGPLSPTGGQSGLGNKLGLNRYEQQATGFKPAEMLRIADEKARNPEASMRASKSREKELARIAAYREAKKQEKLQDQFDATVEYGKSLFGFATPEKVEPEAPAASSLKKAKDQVESRLLQAGSKQLKFAASNEQIMTKEVLENMMNSLVNPNNLLNTRRQVGAANSQDNNEFINKFKTQTAFTANQYGNVMSVLFGTGSGTNGNSLATSLFSKPVFKNGVFQSAVLNEQFLKDNADQINQIKPQLDELANFGSTSNIGKYVDKLSQKRFSKTMINLREALNQSLSSIKPQPESVVDPTTVKQDNPKTGQMPNGNLPASEIPKAQEYKGLYGSSSILDEPSGFVTSAAEKEYANAVRALGDGTTRKKRDRIYAAEQSLSTPSQYKDDEEYREAILANPAYWSTGTAPSSVDDNRSAQQAALLQKLNKGVETLGTYTDNIDTTSGGLNLRPIGGPPLMESTIDPNDFSDPGSPHERMMNHFAGIEQRQRDNDEFRRYNRARGAYSAGRERNRMYPRDGSNAVQAELRALEAEQQAAIDELKKKGIWNDANNMPKYHNGGIAGEMDIRVQEGEGIVQRKSMNKLGASTFNHINKTGELPMKEIKLNVDALMKTPPWMKDFQSSVAALAGTSIKAELAPVSVNVKINGAEVLASIQGQMKDLIKREVMTAVGNMYHDNSGKHLVRGM